jgi:WD40 repeat protein
MWLVGDGFSRTYIGIENLTTGQIVPIRATDDWYRSTYRLYWNPPGTHALLLTWNCGNGVSCFYDSQEADFSLVERATGTHTVLGSNYWISRSGSDDIRLFHRYDRELINPLWSPNGSRAVFFDRYRFIDGQQSGQLMMVSVQYGSIIPLPHLTDIYLWQWMGNDALLVKRDVDDVPYRYDLNTFEVQALTPFRPEYEWYQLSPSGRYLGGDSYNGYRIVDLQTGESIEWVQNGNPCAREVDYLWNTNESWFFTGLPAYCSGGDSTGRGGMSIHSMDGMIQRELTVCARVGTCAGFLPERAIPHLSAGQAESVFIQPKATFGTAGRHEGIVSWSPDSRILVTTSSISIQTATETSTTAALNFWDMSESPTLLGSAETSADCALSCTVQWSADGQQMEWSGNSVSEVWDVANGRLLRQERLFPPPPPNPYGFSYAPLVCEADLHLRPSPMEAGSTLAWVDSRWVRFSSGAQNCSQDSEWLLVLSNNGSGSRLTAVNPQAMHTFDLGERPARWNPIIEYQPDSPLLLATSSHPGYASRMELFDIERGEWLTVPINFFVRDAALSPDGRWIAAAGAQTVTLWDIAEIRARQAME